MSSIRVVALVFPALVLGCGGSQTEAGASAPVAAAAEEPAVRETRIESITEAELRAHVELLSSDAFEGRETLKPGAQKAAKYLAEQFEKFGLRPLPGRGEFRVPYTLDRFVYSVEGNRVELMPNAKSVQKLELGKDFTPFTFSDTGTVENAQVVFAGYGITAPKLSWDDYKGLKVKGKVVLVLRHTPDEKNEKGKFANSRHGLFMTKALNAQKHGAAAMLVVTDPLHHEASADDFSADGFVRLPATAEDKKRREKRQAARRAAQKGKPRLFAAHISQAAAEALIATRRRGKGGLKEIQAKLDTGKLKPRRVALRARATVTITEPSEPVQVKADNVIGFLEGSDPSLKKELVVVGGHYDHLGRGSSGPNDVIYNGADDNASGTAGVLELAQAFGSLKQRPARSIVFVGFSGEEKGLLGSFAMMRESHLDQAAIAFMLNLDMIGRNEDKPVQVLGEAYATTIKEAIEAANKGIGLDITYAGTNYAGNSDHHPFYVRDIPMMFFFTGLHTDYHQVGDHSDKIAFSRMQKIVRLGYAIVDHVAQSDVRPSFIHNLGWLGARIEIVGKTDAARATFTNLEADGRGSKAGLAKGDAITAIDGKLLREPTKVGARFRKIEPGSSVGVDVLRAGKSVKVSLVRAKRGFLGIFPSGVTEDQRKIHGLGENEGVGIRSVTKDGPAEKSGIKAGDILIRIAGVPVSNQTLGKTLARIGAGEKVKIDVLREGDRIDLTMVLGERP